MRTGIATEGRLSSYVRAQLGRARYYAGRLSGRRPRSLEAAAAARCTLAPAEEAIRIPPRMLEGHLDRIRGGAEGEPPGEAIEQLCRRWVRHEATTMCVLENVVLLGSRLYAGDATADLFRGEEFGPNDIAELDEVVLASTHAGARWFGHLIHDEFPLQLLASELGHPIAHARPLYPHEPDYRAIFGVRRPPTVAGFFARRCITLVDHAQNASKRARYAKMRSRVVRPPGPATRVFVRRSGGARRVIANEVALVERLVREGFEVVEKGIDPVDRVVDLCARAERIVGLDGSHMAPCVMVAPTDADIVTILPPDRVSAVLLDVASAVDLGTATYIAEGSLEGDLFVDPEALLRLVA